MAENDPVQENKETADSTQKQERTWATFCHLSSLVAFIGVPFGNILGPLVIWFIKKNEMPLVDQEGNPAHIHTTTIERITLKMESPAQSLFLRPLRVANIESGPKRYDKRRGMPDRLSFVRDCDSSFPLLPPLPEGRLDG